MAAQTVQLSNRLVAIVVRVARADVAELVDAHGSGPCGGNPVEVQVLSSAPPSLREFLFAFSPRVPNQGPNNCSSTTSASVSGCRMHFRRNSAADARCRDQFWLPRW